LDTFII